MRVLGLRLGFPRELPSLCFKSATKSVCRSQVNRRVLITGASLCKRVSAAVLSTSAWCFGVTTPPFARASSPLLHPQGYGFGVRAPPSARVYSPPFPSPRYGFGLLATPLRGCLHCSVHLEMVLGCWPLPLHQERNSSAASPNGKHSKS